MLRLLTFRFLVVLLILTTSACGIVRNRANDYLKADKGKVLVVPEWYEKDKIRSRYPIPDVVNQAVATDELVVPAPPDSTALIVSEHFTIEEMDGQRWLLVTDTPARAWPMIDKFLASKGLATGHSDVESGLIQSSVFQAGKLSTEYARQLDLLADDPADNAGTYHVLLFHLNQGVKRNSSEIQVRVAVAADPSPGFSAWQQEGGDRLAENKVLEDLKLFFEVNRDDKTFSLLAQDIGGPSRVTLVSEGEQSVYLKFELDYARAWGVLGRALRDAGIEVVDRDRSNGEVDIKYYGEDEESFWSKLLSSGPKDLPPNYRLKLKQSGGFVRLDVTGLATDVLDSDNKVKLLSLLLENVS
ncbi:MAG: hypothetical protein CSA50_03245 [Gammaproteobacteria bacterium]|nr:MAG: hypothetical protein CSA50_03245 [Gammaproteobacteria bacterium]